MVMIYRGRKMTPEDLRKKYFLFFESLPKCVIIQKNEIFFATPPGSHYALITQLLKETPT